MIKTFTIQFSHTRLSLYRISYEKQSMTIKEYEKTSVVDTNRCDFLSSILKYFFCYSNHLQSILSFILTEDWTYHKTLLPPS